MQVSSEIINWVFLTQKKKPKSKKNLSLSSISKENYSPEQELSEIPLVFTKWVHTW